MTAANNPYDIPVGVYRLRSAGGRLLYVGAGERPQLRWSDHRRKQPWWPEVDESQTTVDWFPNRALALAEESRAIAEEDPLHNKQGTRKLRRPLATDYQLPTEICGSAEIGLALGVSRQRIQQLLAEPDFPRPFKVLAAGRLYLTDEVEAWIGTNRVAA